MQEEQRLPDASLCNTRSQEGRVRVICQDRALCEPVFSSVGSPQMSV